MTWCFGFNYENGRKRTKKKKKRRSRRGGRRKTVVKFGLCDESGPPSNPRILMSIFSNQSEPILLHWNLMKKSSLLPFVSIRFLIAVALFFVVYVGPTGPSFINHWTNLHSPLFSSPSFHLTLSLSIILGLKNRPMFLTEPCPLNLISKTEIERGRGCPSVSPPPADNHNCLLSAGTWVMFGLPWLQVRFIWQGGLGEGRTHVPWLR